MDANTLALMAQGFGNALDPMNLLMMAIGVIIGVIVGCMPGLSAAMGVALLLPLTFGMKAETGLIMLGGYELTKQGRAGKALGTACTASFFGGLLSCISLYFFAPLLAELAMKFGSPEYFWLALFGLTIIACFLGYNTAKQFSKTPEKFGHGSIEGVAGSEAANNAVTGGSLIPTLTLGIPGESVTAVLMGGLIIQSLQPGPELFTKYAPMTYTFFAGFVIVQFFMLLIGLGGCRIFAHIAKISDAILIPCIFVLCVVGSFAINNSFVDVVLMFIFGVMGYLMRKMGLNTAAVVLALILGPIGERGLRRSLTLSGNDISILFSTPICWGLIILCVLSAFSPLLMDWLKKGKAAIKG